MVPNYSFSPNNISAVTLLVHNISLNLCEYIAEIHLCIDMFNYLELHHLGNVISLSYNNVVCLPAVLCKITHNILKYDKELQYRMNIGAVFLKGFSNNYFYFIEQPNWQGMH